MPVTSTPTIDVVIPTRNRPELIDCAITSICASDTATIALWVIDQSDDERTAELVARHQAIDARVHYVRIPPQGISAARNSGVAAGRAPVVLFTDDDCRVEPAWAREMAAALAEPGVWAVFGRVLPERSEAEAEDEVTAGLSLGVKPSEQPERFAGNRFNLSFGHGANMGVRREQLLRLGGFDPLLGTGAPLYSWEDRDLGYRMLAAGGTIVYTPAALLYHRQWRSWRAVRRTTGDYGLGAGAVAGKYLRLGDWGGLVLLGDWLFHQGLRQLLSGLLKWRSAQKSLVGLQQLITPWRGLIRSLAYPLDKTRRLYRHHL